MKNLRVSARVVVALMQQRILRVSAGVVVALMQRRILECLLG